MFLWHGSKMKKKCVQLCLIACCANMHVKKIVGPACRFLLPTYRLFSSYGIHVYLILSNKGCFSVVKVYFQKILFNVREEGDVSDFFVIENKANSNTLKQKQKRSSLERELIFLFEFFLFLVSNGCKSWMFLRRRLQVIQSNRSLWILRYIKDKK